MTDRYTAAEIFSFCQENWPESCHPVHRYALYLHRLAELDTEVHQFTRSLGISPTEFDILATLRRSPPPHVLNPTELQRSTLLSSGGQTKLFYQLEEKGFIERSVNEEDKRSKFVHLTMKGKGVVETAMTAVLNKEIEWLNVAGMNVDELAQLTHLLSRLLTVLES